MQTRRLEGEAALITGGASGIGKAIARLFLLLRFAGCAATSHEIAARLGGDDVVVRARGDLIDASRLAEALRFLAGLGDGAGRLRMLGRAAGASKFFAESGQLTAGTLRAVPQAIMPTARAVSRCSCGSAARARRPFVRQSADPPLQGRRRPRTQRRPVRRRPGRGHRVLGVRGDVPAGPRATPGPQGRRHASSISPWMQA